MEIRFEKDYLEELYLRGSTTNKKHRFQKAIVTKYKNTIDTLRAAQTPEELYPIRSLHFEKLKGNKKGLASVRVDKKYRIEFKTDIEGLPPNTVHICAIVKLSNHYQ